MQPEPRLRDEDAAHRRLEARTRNLAGIDRRLHPAKGVHRVPRIEDDVDAGEHGFDGILAGRAHLDHGVHVHRVRVNQAVEAEGLAQQTGDDRPAERRRPGCLVERRQLDVRDHHARRAGGDAGAKRRELDLIEPLARMRNHRQPEMRVHGGVAMPGKMLERGQHAALLQPADPCGRQRTDTRRRPRRTIEC